MEHKTQTGLSVKAENPVFLSAKNSISEGS